MRNLLIGLFIITVVSGCTMAGHGGAITDDGGLEAACAGGCAEYNSNGKGCAVFHKDTSQSCASYFDKLCERNPKQCTN